MTSDTNQVTRSIYATILRKDLPSPLTPKTDEENVLVAEDKAKVAAGKPAGANSTPAPVAPIQIDLESINQRIVALPIPAADYTDLQTGKAGELFFLQQVPSLHTSALKKFSLASRSMTDMLSGVEQLAVSFDGEKLLFRQGQRWGIAGTSAAIKTGEGLLNMEAMSVWRVPRDEWKQM